VQFATTDHGKKGASFLSVEPRPPHLRADKGEDNDTMTDSKLDALRAALVAEAAAPKDSRARADSKTAKLRALLPTIAALRARRPPTTFSRIAELCAEHGLDVSADLIARVVGEGKKKATTTRKPTVPPKSVATPSRQAARTGADNAPQPDKTPPATGERRSVRPGSTESHFVKMEEDL
jgi:hypothetical protein